MAISRKNIAASNGTDASTNEPFEEMPLGDGDDTADESSLIAELREECNLLCKLRIIEAICHAYGKNEIPKEEILRILYEADEPRLRMLHCQKMRTINIKRDI